MKGSAMLERVLKTISRYSMLAPGARVVVAVSGGADSVCLLHVLRELGVTVVGVAHFNHQLRGEESDQDERFVAGLAARLGLDFFCGGAPIGAAPGNLEQAARHARRDFFSGLIRDGRAGRVALGHTRDDQAETVLFRFLRGSGLTGLAGIHPVTAGGLIRPLIDVTRAEVEQFLRSRQIPWREDSTNRDPHFARNRIRRELLPQLAREWNPQIVQTLAHLADLCHEEERWRRILPGLEDGTGPIEFHAASLAALPRAQSRRILRQSISRARGDLRGIEFHHIESVLELAAGPAGQGKLTLPGVVAIRSFDWLRLSPPLSCTPVEPVAVTVPGTYAAPGGLTAIRFEVDETKRDLSCDTLKVELAWRRVQAPLQLRGWRPGDHYRPVGQSRDQKMKELFQKARIPSWRRRFWPILTSGSMILWASGFGPAEEFAAGEDPGPVLRIYEGNGVAG